MTTLLLAKPASIYGVGPAYPFQLDATRTRPKIAREEELVLMSMRQILLTVPGEEPFLVRNGRLYGTGFLSALFEDVETAKTICVYETRVALETWEPRIVVLDVTATVVGKEIRANTKFQLRRTSRVDNFVVPYRTTSIDALVL